MNFRQYQGLISRLCRELARFYVTREEIIAFVTKAGLDPIELSISNRSIDTWRSVIMHALEEEKLHDLIQLAQRDNPESHIIIEAVHYFYLEKDPQLLEKKINKRAEKKSLRQLLDYLDNSWAGFQAQNENRDKLMERMVQRLDIREEHPIEEFFELYFDQMNKFERRIHRVIREYTDYIRVNNEKALEIIELLPGVEEKIGKLKKLRRHLRVWLHKYDKVFLNDPEMCLLYTNLYDGTPFPRGVEKEIRNYLDRKKR